MSTADEVFDSWEEIEESGALDKKLNSLQMNASECLEDNQLPILTGTKNSSTRMIILGEDGMRSQYVPPKPTVKILKRPQRESQGSGDGPLTNGEKPKQPIKSLRQREQEYAEARKRILGEERSPEEQISQEISKIQAKQGCGLSNDMGNNAMTMTTTTTTAMMTTAMSNVIRMPMGPDGTRGFNARR